jgi:hypothetical protein
MQTEEGSTVSYNAGVGYNWLVDSTCNPFMTDPETWKALNKAPWIQMDLVYATAGEEKGAELSRMFKNGIRKMLKDAILWLTGPEDLYMRVLDPNNPEGYTQPFLEGKVEPGWRDVYKKEEICLLEVHFWMMDFQTRGVIENVFFQTILHPYVRTRYLQEKDKPFLIPLDPYTQGRACMWRKIHPAPLFTSNN